MDQFALEAFACLDYWQINVDRRHQLEGGEWVTDKLYRGHHVPIDDEDPLIRAVLLLHQVVSDLEQAIRDDSDMLADRPMSH